ncbi:FAD/NAD(P)-binding domain-containing protein [Polyplosphaeria fusca]|uniref:FAD/NAD(P)-binding domain-containing protein n=1 Tax=Polyplosphaeria fusca TaxID=682080 RepID=A0A9P4R8C9_9PLEO|nr:FAD/NAD(P)-binding domain-containing protein [Polyplosphaeria fusca]
MSTERHHASILIVGAGIFGTSTAYHLSHTHSSPSSITVLDRSPYPPRHAASTDINKIVRADYSDRFYMDLAYEAMEAWKSWTLLQQGSSNTRSESGGPLFHDSGWVSLSGRGSDLADRIRTNFRDRGSDSTEDVEVGEKMRKDWGNVLEEARFEDIEKAYWNPDAGWADAGDAVERMMNHAIERGVSYNCGDVKELILGDNHVKGVRTKDGRLYEADKVMLCTGAWTSQLLSPVEDELEINEVDRVEKQVTAAGVCVVHYQLSAEEHRKLSPMPVIIYSDKGEVLPPPRHNPLLKFTNARSFTSTITTPTAHKISVPPDRDQTEVSEKLKTETLSSIVHNTMPSFVSREVDHWRLCWDAITPSQNQLITKHPHPHLSNLFLAVGGSFHSWKFLPTIGKYVVNVLNGDSNGDEKDERWKWKTGAFEGRGAHEKVVPQRELSELED